MTIAVPELTIRLGCTMAVNCVALTNVVSSANPLNSTVDRLTNPAPLTVRVKPGPPAAAVFGLKLVIVRSLIVKGIGLEVPPSGFTTVTIAVPGLAIRLAATAAVNCVAFTKAVGNIDPFHSTVDPPTNPAPFTTSVNAAPPRVRAFGLTLVSPTGLTVNNTALEALPPGFTTVILAVRTVEIRLAGTVAVNCVALTKAVANAAPFQATVEPPRNPVPFTISVNAAPPLVAPVGFRLVMAGAAIEN